MRSSGRARACLGLQEQADPEHGPGQTATGRPGRPLRKCTAWVSSGFKEVDGGELHHRDPLWAIRTYLPRSGNLSKIQR